MIKNDLKICNFIDLFIYIHLKIRGEKKDRMDDLTRIREGLLLIERAMEESPGEGALGGSSRRSLVMADWHDKGGTGRQERANWGPQ